MAGEIKKMITDIRTKVGEKIIPKKAAQEKQRKERSAREFENKMGITKKLRTEEKLGGDSNMAPTDNGFAPRNSGKNEFVSYH